MPIILKREQKPNQVITVQPGSKYDLDKVFDPAKTISVKLNAAGQDDIDFACFGVDSDGHAQERFSIFYGETSSPGNEIIFMDGSTNPNPALFQLELSRIPKEIKKLVFTVSAQDSGSTLDISGLDVDIRQNDAGFHLLLSGADFSTHKSIIAVELSLGSVRQLKAPAKGFDGDLGGLMKHFGLEVEEDTSSDAPPGEPVVQRDGKIWIDSEEFIVDPENDWV
jgi:stress response protein SCP2